MVPIRSVRLDRARPGRQVQMGAPESGRQREEAWEGDPLMEGGVPEAIQILTTW